jgi:hypothetical protein
MEPEVLLLCPQEPTIGPFPEPDESSPQMNPTIILAINKSSKYFMEDQFH